MTGKRKRPVATYTRQGELVAIYPSVTAAGEALNINSPSVHRAIRQPYYAVRDHYVRRADDGAPERIDIVETPSRVRRHERQKTISEVKRERRDAQRVIELDPRTKEPTGLEFETAAEAARHFGVTRQMISLVLVHPDKNKTVKGKMVAYKFP